jgi:hypothetical protein
MAFAYMALIALIATAAIKQFRPHLFSRPKKDHLALDAVQPAQQIVLVFIVLSYIAWQSVFSILRYALVIEVLSIPATIIIVRHAARSFFPRHKRAALFVAVPVCLIAIVLTHMMDWERVEYGNAVFDVDMSWVPRNTLFLDVGKPVAYLAAFVPPEAEARFVDGGAVYYQADRLIGKKISGMIASNPGPIKALLTEAVMAKFFQTLPYQGLTSKPRSCRVIHSNLDPQEPVYACDLVRSASFLNNP